MVGDIVTTLDVSVPVTAVTAQHEPVEGSDLTPRILRRPDTARSCVGALCQTTLAASIIPTHSLELLTLDVTGVGPEVGQGAGHHVTCRQASGGQKGWG